MAGTDLYAELDTPHSNELALPERCVFRPEDVIHQGPFRLDPTVWSPAPPAREQTAADRRGAKSKVRHARRLHSALRAAGIGVWDWDLLCGDAARPENSEALFGALSGAPKVAANFANMVYLEDRRRVSAAAVLAIEHKGRFECEYRVRMPDGQLRWMTARGRAVRDLADNATHMIGATLDITDRKKKEAAMKKSIERFRSLVTSGADAVWTTDRRGKLIQGSASWATLTGQNYCQMKGSRWLDAVHPEDRERIRALWMGMVHRTEPFKIEYRVRRRDGIYRHVISRGAPMLDEKGTVREWIGTVEDVTEQRQAQTRTARQNRVLQLLATGQDLPAVLTALIETIEEPCPCMIGSILLLDEDGKHLRHLAAPNLPPEYVQAIDGVEIGPAAGSCGTAAHLRQRVVVEDIETSPLWAGHREFTHGHGLRACWSQPIFGGDSRLLGTFAMYYREPRGPSAEEMQLIESAAHLAGVAIEHHRRQAALLRAKEAAEAATAAKDLFLSTATHELRTPLSAIILWAGLLRTSQTEEARNEAIDVIEEQAHAQSRLVEDILDASRMAHGKLRVDLRPLDLAEALHAAIDTVRPSAETEGVCVQSDGCPASGVLALGDPARLQQVFSNLLTNAVKFTPRGGRVQIRMEHDADAIHINFIDSGRGIDPQFLPHVFEALTQAGGPGPHGSTGLGLGLSIVKRLVEQHGGSIAASSEGCGRGATFTVTLPAFAGRFDEVHADENMPWNCSCAR